MSGYTEIFLQETYHLRQFISSGIMQQCPTPFQTKMAGYVYNYKNHLNGKFCFTHYDLDSDNNYGIINIDENNRISCNWVKSREDKKIIPYETKQVIFDDTHKHSCCCNIY